MRWSRAKRAGRYGFRRWVLACALRVTREASRADGSTSFRCQRRRAGEREPLRGHEQLAKDGRTSSGVETRSARRLLNSYNEA